MPGHVGTLYCVMGSRYTGRSSARIDLILPNGQPISSRAISKIHNDECGQRYAAEQLAAAGARTRRSGENGAHRSEEHTSELQSLMRISYAVFCLKKKNKQQHNSTHDDQCN